VKRWIYNIRIALEAVLLNRFRSLLTGLGIIFGVAAVIAMMAIGQGAKQEILEQIRLVGVNNIIITPQRVDTEEQESTEAKSSQDRYSPGLTLLDVENIRLLLPGLKHISPEVNYETEALRAGRGSKLRIRGVNNDYFGIFNLTTTSGGFFTAAQMENAAPVCVIGAGIRVRFFPNEDPIGKRIKCGSIWLTVLGVLEPRGTPGDLLGMGISNHDESVYAPVTTVLLRFRDRSLITASLLRGNAGNESSAVSSGAQTSEEDAAAENHQLSKIIVQMTSSDQLKPAEEVLNRMLLRRHGEVQDFRVNIPEALLKQEQRTRDIFNIVLGAIAGIALLVGGIGIMNIMLASVMERIKEIGIRQAMGARRSDIVFQFLAESTMISVIGGMIGVVLGVVLARLIMHLAGILTIISFWSILLSFGVAAAIGIVFGFMPARKAARQDPVESLRHE